MDIWVRSQDKYSIEKIEKVKMFETDNKIEPIFYEIHGLFKGNEINTYERLGCYKTEKRALEVLDEIQELLKFPFESYGELQRPKIYEMPKE